MPLNFILLFKTSPVPVPIFPCNLASRFRQLKEQENRRKLNKALASGDSKASASAYDPEDEESDDETEEEVFLTHFRYLYIFL